MDIVVAAWWSWMPPMLWQSSLLVAILAVVDRLIRGWAWPQVRYALWLLVLIKLVLPPWWAAPGGGLPAAATRVASVVESRLVSSGPADAAVDRIGRRKPSSADGAGVETRAVEPRPGQGRVGGGMTVFWPTVAFLVWLVGMVVVGFVIALRISRLARWHREQETRPRIPEWFHELLIETSKRLGLERVPAVVFSDQAVTPAVYGLFRPVLLLPAHFTDTLSRQEVEHMLLHEMAHLKRGDLVVHAVFLGLRVAYWFNPFVAYAHRQLRHVREICCDLTVAALLRDKTVAYRRTLVDTARHLLTESLEPGMGLLGVFEEPYKVLARIRWLERPTWEYRRMMTVAAGMVALLAAPVLLPMAADGAVPGAVAVATTAGGPADAPGEDGSATGSAEDGASHVYIKSVFRIEQVVLGFVLRSEQAAVSEIWVGPDVISVSERNRTVIFDRTRRHLTLIDHPSETWVETPLPLEIDAVLGQDLQRGRREIRTTGEVEETEDSRRILGRKCPEFRVTSWNSRGSSRSNPQTFSVWTSTDVPFDLALLDQVVHNLRLLYNRDAGYRRELEKMPGLQMRLEMRQGSRLAARRFVDEVVEISRGDPPPGIYRPPWGYRRIDRFERLDL
jgi:beta-lactamase regulating signal transducer with metallopeptidase domain